MKITHTMGGCSNLIKGKEFPMNTVVMYLGDGRILACKSLKNYEKLQAYCYIPTKQKWVIVFVGRNCKSAIYKYYNANIRRRNGGKNKIDCAQLMRHDRKHKKAGGGKISHVQTVTDYECTKNPLHDFRRVYN